ncbi:MAG: PAS domain-containing protein [Alphaproteobacteria bacterium]|nr:PAS domain-containing protein [Alphaproteobacteria bacterium]
MLLPDGEHPVFENAEIDALFGYWEALRRARGGRLPGRQHVDPAELMARRPALVPDLWMVDVEYPGPRFRFRQMGGSLVDAGVPGEVGTYLDEIEDATKPGAIVPELAAACVGKAAIYKVGAPTLSHSRFVPRLERLCVPLAADGENIDMFLCATHYTWTVPRPFPTGLNPRE